MGGLMRHGGMNLVNHAAGNLFGGGLVRKRRGGGAHTRGTIEAALDRKEGGGCAAADETAGSTRTFLKPLGLRMGRGVPHMAHLRSDASPLTSSCR